MLVCCLKMATLTNGTLHEKQWLRCLRHVLMLPMFGRQQHCQISGLATVMMRVSSIIFYFVPTTYWWPKEKLHRYPVSGIRLFEPLDWKKPIKYLQQKWFFRTFYEFLATSFSSASGTLCMYAAVAAAVRWLFQRLALCTVTKVWWGQCRHGAIKKVLVS